MILKCFDMIDLVHCCSLRALWVVHFLGIPIRIKFRLLFELENLLCEGGPSDNALHKVAILHFLVQSLSCLRRLTDVNDTPFMIVLLWALVNSFTTSIVIIVIRACFLHCLYLPFKHTNAILQLLWLQRFWLSGKYQMLCFGQLHTDTADTRTRRGMAAGQLTRDSHISALLCSSSFSGWLCTTDDT